MVDWKFYIDSPQKRVLHLCSGSLDEDDGDGDGKGYGKGCGGGWGDGWSGNCVGGGVGGGQGYGWVNDSDGVSSSKW